jgi:hypothetical protein
MGCIVDVATSSSHEDTPSNTGNSDNESRSIDSDDTSSESDSLKWAKLATVAATAGITFDFDASNVGKVRVSVMEQHGRYLPKDHSQSPGP